jgi:hypothetical protein
MDLDTLKELEHLAEPSPCDSFRLRLTLCLGQERDRHCPARRSGLDGIERAPRPGRGVFCGKRTVTWPKDLTNTGHGVRGARPAPVGAENPLWWTRPTRRRCGPRARRNRSRGLCGRTVLYSRRNHAIFHRGPVSGTRSSTACSVISLERGVANRWKATK